MGTKKKGEVQNGYNKIGAKIGTKIFSKRGYEICHRAFLAERG